MAYLPSRNRLENNSDHWNALLLSLRELSEWTISKEAELEAMGPIGGDEHSIRRQQVNYAAAITLIMCLLRFVFRIPRVPSNASSKKNERLLRTIFSLAGNIWIQPSPQ